MKKNNRLTRLLCRGFLFLCLQLFVTASIWGEELYGQQNNKIISVDLKDVTLLNALEYLTDVMGCEILYNHEQVASDKKFDLNMKDKTVEEILQKCLQGTNLSYKVVNDVFVLTVKDEKEEKKAKEITGVVVGVKGDSIPGVTVLIKGTTIGTSTDAKGLFKMTIPPTVQNNDLALVFSFIGMKTQEVKVGDKTKFRIVLEEDKEELEEVVVTGYANIKKTSFTGNAVTVTKDELKKVSHRNIVSALQTFDPSLRIRENNTWGSDPNALPEFSVRGNSSMGIGDLERSSISKSELKNNSNLPVFIMDGFEVSAEKVYDFDINRIESVTILKDAAATAMYGSRAANGVIVITTVAPKPGQLQVDYNFAGDITTPDLRDYNLMNAEEKLAAEVAAGCYDDEGPLFLNDEYNAKLNNILRGVDTDWLSQPVETVFNHKHSIYIQGGTNDLRFGVDMKYDNQKGVMKGSYRDNIGAGFSLDYRIKELQIKNYISYNVMKSKESPYGIFSDYTKKQPYDEMKDEFGNYTKNTPLWHDGGNIDTKNPLYEAGLLSFEENSYTELIDQLSLNWYMENGILIKGDFSITKKDTKYDKFTDPESATYDNTGNFHNDLNKKGDRWQTRGQDVNWNLNLLVTYNKSISNHNINLSLGLNAVNRESESSSEHFRGFPNGMLNKPAYAYEIVDKPNVTESASRLFGLFLTANYTYNDIYLADLSVRTDGSSEFGSDQRFAPFWSGGLGLNIHNFEFMKNQGIVELLKIRGSYGQLGKGNFPAYAAVTTYEVNTDNWYSTGYGAGLTYLGNTDLKWEKTNTTDVGLEFSVLRGLFYFKGSYYWKKTVDLITDVTIPSYSGFSSYKDNLGEIMNKGYELDIRSNLINKPDLQIALYANLAHNKNEILKISEQIAAYNKDIEDYYNSLGDSEEEAARVLTQYVPGGSTTSIFAMKSLGIDPSNGKDMFLKKDGTITYDWDPREVVIVGNEEADAQGAFGVNALYKGFTLFVSFMYEFGGQRYNNTLVSQVENADIYNYNADKRVLSDRWQKPGDITPLKDIKDRAITTRPTSRFVQDYNVLSLSSFSFGYDFPTEWVRKCYLSRLNVTFNMNDAFRWSSVREERGTSYPYARTFSFTLNASF